MELQKELPAGYRMEIGGEEEDQVKGFKDLVVVLAISVVADLSGAGVPV